MSIKLVNASSQQTVYTRLFTLDGTCPADSTTVSLSYEGDRCPCTTWPVSQGNFKALVMLEPGLNKFLLTSNGSHPASIRSSLNYIPLLQNPPLYLVLMAGKDSPCNFDSPYQPKNNGLDEAIEKVRMAGYLMQAYTAEQMRRNGFSTRTFRLEEQWARDTVFSTSPKNRSTARVHLLRCQETVDQIRDPDRAQQNRNAKKSGDLFQIAMRTLRNHGYPYNVSPAHVAVIFLDAHWDDQKKLLLGHAALGGGSDDIRLAIFGSQGLWSWPNCIEEVVKCFTNSDQTNTKFVVNDSNESGTAWECANVSMGAFMHEIGHLFGCPHEPSGVMLRDYLTFNRSFVTHDGSWCSRLNRPGQTLALPQNECKWHRLDVLRFRHHAAFRLPEDDQLVYTPTAPTVLPIDHAIYCYAPNGAYCVELHDGDKGADSETKGWIEYANPSEELFLIEEDLRSKMPAACRSKKLALKILARGQKETVVPDFAKILKNCQGPQGQLKSLRYGGYGNDEDKAQVIQWPDKIRKIRIFASAAVVGIEVLDLQGKSVLFGSRGANAHEFQLTDGEDISAVHFRCGAWVDAVGVVTSKGRKTQIFGGSGGGWVRLAPPSGFKLTGITGTWQGRIVSFGIMYRSIKVKP